MENKQPTWQDELAELYNENEPVKVRDFVQSLLDEQRQELRKEIIILIAKECNIARSEEQPTSRLTSLSVKINELLEEKFKVNSKI